MFTTWTSGSVILVCRTFSREVSTAKLGITPGQCSVALELIQKLAYASSDEQYESLYEQFVTSVPSAVMTYYNDNWHAIRGEWVLGLKFFSSSFMNTTNNRLERLNGQLKEVINRNSSLEDFLEKLYVVLTSLCNEHDHKVALQFQKVPVSHHERGSPQQLYSTPLTTYATKFVLKQLKMQTKIDDMVPLEELQSFCIPSREGNLQVSPFECPCMFRCAICLPCRHIFAVRRKLCMTLYDPALCLDRWLLTTCRNTQRLFSHMQ